MKTITWPGHNRAHGFEYIHAAWFPLERGL